MSVFHRFEPRLQAAIAQVLGWDSLREVQELAAAAILDGCNAVVLAPTAGGKTEAAFFPILSELLRQPLAGTQCLYISPIRALLNNQEERLGVYTQMVGLRRFKWHGEAKQKDKRQYIQDPSELLMITPESLEVMLISPSVPHARLFENLRFVVVDEIHALADCDRGSHLLAILERLRFYSSHDFQRIGLSATVGNFEAILDWLQGSSQRPGQVVNPAKPPSRKQIEVKYLDEFDLAREACRRGKGKKSLFFADSRARAEKMAQAMREQEIEIFVHHSSVSRERREWAEAQMTHGKNVAIVCTSTLELGIDVGELDLIFQAEAPSTVASFLQRMGRTGRRPQTIANTTFFTTQQESMLQAIALVELARDHWVEDVRLDHKAWHILVHQVMALCLQYGALPRSQIWSRLKAAACFRDISSAQFQILIDYLVNNQDLSEESGLISMGLRAEKTFGSKNFLELYSVFTSPVDYKVVTQGGQTLGTVEWQFAEMIEPEACFNLGGKSWLVKRIEHSQKQLVVDKAPAGKAPKWGGYAPRLLSYELCRKIREVLLADTVYPYCDSETLACLKLLRQEKRFLAQGFAPYEMTEKAMIWWTYAGGRINQTLKNAILATLGVEVIANNYYLKFQLTEVSERAFEILLQKLKSPALWEDPHIHQALVAALPAQRLSKFQPCLPPVYEQDLLAHAYLDIPATLAFLNQISEVS